jgi:transcriptional regulator with PAS, ATPase and Fis domain
LEAVRLAHIAAGSASTVLLHGETGTGKEVFAQSIHSGSARASGPFVAINCAAIPRELISSELFGYEGGSFTGADRQGRPGKFELANGGTLFG